MTQAQRAELKRLESEASDGPWEVTSREGDLYLRDPHGSSLMCDMRYYLWAPEEADFRFIAAARNSVPDLLAENERMRELLRDSLTSLGGFGDIRKRLKVRQEIEDFLEGR